MSPIHKGRLTDHLLGTHPVEGAATAVHQRADHDEVSLARVEVERVEAIPGESASAVVDGPAVVMAHEEDAMGYGVEAPGGAGGAGRRPLEIPELRRVVGVEP